MHDQDALDDVTDRLEHNALFIGFLPALVLGAVLLFVQPLVGVLVALVGCVGWVLLVKSRLSDAPARAMAPLVGTPLAPGSHPRLENVLDGLCATSGVSDPSVSLVESSSINALVAADRTTTSIVLTTGLVDGLDRLELEGVVANLLGRVKDGSARYTTTVLALLGTSARAQTMIDRQLGDQRPVLSDLAAVDLTRYPPGLISALTKMARTGTLVQAAPTSTAPLWIAPAVESPTGVSTDHDDTGAQPLSMRIAVLSEL